MTPAVVVLMLAAYSALGPDFNIEPHVFARYEHRPLKECQDERDRIEAKSTAGRIFVASCVIEQE